MGVEISALNEGWPLCATVASVCLTHWLVASPLAIPRSCLYVYENVKDGNTFKAGKFYLLTLVGQFLGSCLFVYSPVKINNF